MIGDEGVHAAVLIATHVKSATHLNSTPALDCTGWNWS